MNILAIDTSSKLCGVCILENEKEIYKIDTITENSHSERLMPIIDEVFNNTNLKLSDIDLIVCDKGPGSFTGIRIGVSTAKAFSDSLNIQTIGISSLEALAYNIKNANLICSIIDAKNSNCYYGLYQLKDSKYIEVESPKADSIENCLKTIKKYKKDITFVGDGSVNYKYDIISKINDPIFATDSENILNSYNLGIAGYENFKIGNIQENLPMYLKKPQAQRQLEEKLNGNTNKQHAII